MTEATLFGDIHVPVRKGSTDYLTDLHELTLFSEGPEMPGPWTFWALAPVEPRWLPAREGPAGEYDHVWLTHPTEPGVLYQALVELTTGRIVRRRVYD